MLHPRSGPVPGFCKEQAGNWCVGLEQSQDSQGWLEQWCSSCESTWGFNYLHFYQVPRWPEASSHPSSQPSTYFSVSAFADFRGYFQLVVPVSTCVLHPPQPDPDFAFRLQRTFTHGVLLTLLAPRMPSRSSQGGLANCSGYSDLDCFSLSELNSS